MKLRTESDISSYTEMNVVIWIQGGNDRFGWKKLGTRLGVLPPGNQKILGFFGNNIATTFLPAAGAGPYVVSG